MYENKLILKEEAVPNGWYESEWNGSAIHKEIRRDLTDAEIAEIEIRANQEKDSELQSENKSNRARYLDAYRKYQASVNYGEYERVPEVDAFVRRLQDKDWTALEDVPPALAYFAGECGFDEGGLKKVGG